MLLLSCSNLSRGYDATPLFEHVSFEIHAGERIGFVGPNGAGKTTLLRILGGIDEPDSGKVTLHAGARLGGHAREDLRADLIAPLLCDIEQPLHLLPVLDDPARLRHQVLAQTQGGQVDRRLDAALDGLVFAHAVHPRSVHGPSEQPPCGLTPSGRDAPARQPRSGVDPTADCRPAANRPCHGRDPIPISLS